MDEDHGGSPISRIANSPVLRTETNINIDLILLEHIQDMKRSCTFIYDWYWSIYLIVSLTSIFGATPKMMCWWRQTCDYLQFRKIQTSSWKVPEIGGQSDRSPLFRTQDSEGNHPQDSLLQLSEWLKFIQIRRKCLSSRTSCTLKDPQVVKWTRKQWWNHQVLVQVYSRLFYVQISICHLNASAIVTSNQQSSSWGSC